MTYSAILPCTVGACVCVWMKLVEIVWTVLMVAADWCELMLLQAVICPYIACEDSPIVETSVGFRSWSRYLSVSLQATEAIKPAVGCHYFSPSQLPSITTHWPVPNYTAWWQRHVCVNKLCQGRSQQRGGRCLYWQTVEHAVQLGVIPLHWSVVHM